MNGPFESASAKAAKARARLEALDRERAILVRLIEHLEKINSDTDASSGVAIGDVAPPDASTSTGMALGFGRFRGGSLDIGTNTMPTSRWPTRAA